MTDGHDTPAGTAAAGALTAAALAALRPRRGERILQVGSGDGRLVLDLAAAVGPDGTAIGAEASAALAQEAHLAAVEAGISAVFVVARPGHPGIGAGTVDGILLVRVLSRVPDPAEALRRCVAAVVPGGRLVLAEHDWGGLRMTHPDRGATRAVLAPARVGLRRPRLARELGALAREAGLRVASERRVVTRVAGSGRIDALLQARAAALSPVDHDGLDPVVAAEWWRTVVAADAEGGIRATLPGVVVTAVREGRPPAEA